MDESGRIGGIGIESRIFKGIKKGTESIKMKYRRSWESNSTTKDTLFVIKVN